MRRVLFGDGIPRKVPVQTGTPIDPGLQIFSTMHTPEAHNLVHLFTLYAFAVGGAPPAAIQLLFSDGTNVTSAAYSQDSKSNPVLLCQQMACRGPFNLYAGVVSADLTTEIYIYGYYELSVSNPNLAEIRPLQPTNTLTAPYSGGPQTIYTLGGGTTPIHQLQPGYTDEVTFRYLPNLWGELPVPSKLVLGATQILLPEVVAPEDVKMVTLFDGIPMRSNQQLKISAVRQIYQGSFKRF